ncbi:MAG: hypothetical protein IT454_12145 [Planctomycetes bacterium]|nr:hypothetical protein [Planctomycetota bacterium]
MSGWRDPRDQDPSEPELPRWIFLHSLRVTIGRTPVWLSAASLIGVLALAQALPWFAYYDSVMSASFERGALLRELSETFRFDTRDERAPLEASTRALGAVLALLAMLIGAFSAGGWLQVFLEHTQGESVRRFFYGGARFFFRFVRVLLFTLFWLCVLGWLVYGRPWEWLVLENVCGLAKPDLELFESEGSVRTVGLVQDGVYALGFGCVMVWGDYTRTRLAVHGTRSAVWAGLCTIALLVVHPIRSLRPLLLLSLVELGVLAIGWFLAGLIGRSIDADSSLWPVLGLVAVGLGAHLWRSITRGARYSACVLTTRDVVRPLARPDPWKRSVGGPGGPRYPIDGDEYGVAL